MISVIITSFNYERFIAEAIASALDQRDGHAEVILVDDGSTDGSPAVIESFGDRVTAVLGANRGQAAAQNTGYELSSGEGVIFLDADDVLLPSAARRATEALADREVAKVHWTLPVIDAQGEDAGILQDRELAEGDLRSHFFAEGPLTDATMPSPPSSGNAFARWFLEEVMPIPEDTYFRSPDEYLFGLAPGYGRIVRIEPQSLYRIHGSNTSLLRPFEKQLSFQLAHHATMLREGRKAAERAGVGVAEEGWGAGAWWLRTAHVVETIEELIPAGAELAVGDETLLGFGTEIRGRRLHPFPVHEGEWAGNPVDDEHALGALARLGDDGVAYLAIAWPVFWWFDEYPRFAGALGEKLELIARDDDLVLFAVRDR